MTKRCISCGDKVEQEVSITRQFGDVGEIRFYAHIRCISNQTATDKITYLMPSLFEIAGGLRQ